VGQILEGATNIGPADQKLLQIAKPISEFADQVGKEAVDLGLLNPESYQKYKGQYMTHIFQDMTSGGSLFSKSSVVPKISGQFFKHRTGAEGYVQQFSPAVFKGLGTEIKDIETANMLKQVGEKTGQVMGENLAPGMVDAATALTNSKAAKVLSGTSIPQSVADILNKYSEIQKPGVYQKIMGAWKAGKTIYNPAYHVRNLFSNQILSDMSTGRGAMTIPDYVKSVASYLGKGDQKFFDAAETSGLIKRQGFGQTLDEFMKSAGLVKPEAQNIGQKVVQGVGKVGQKMADFQQFSEDTAKLSVFKVWLEKFAEQAGKSVDEALQDPNIIKFAKDKAEEAIFSPNRINKAERSLASKYVPFYSFTRQAVPFTAKTLVNNPSRLTKYEKAKTAVESLSPEGSANNPTLPDYRQGQVRLPYKDKAGNYAYLDPQYIMPYGNFGDTGMTQGRLPFGLSVDPFATELAQQTFNKDLYFGQPIAKSNIPAEAAKQRIAHVARTVLPQLYTTLTSKLAPAMTGQLDYAGRERGKIMSILDAAGIKTSIFRPEEQQKFNLIDKQSKIKSIMSERYSVIRNQSLSPEKKQYLLQQLDKVRQDTMSQP
jgi:hypothetical protein